MTEWCVINQALPARSPSHGFGHVGFDGSLVDEGQPFQMADLEGLAFGDPDAALRGDILALLLKRLKVFSYASARGHEDLARRCRDEP